MPPSRFVLFSLVLVLGACAPPARGLAPRRPLATISYPESGGLVLLPIEIAGRDAGLWILDSGFECSVLAQRSASHLGILSHAPSRERVPGGEVEQAWTDSLDLRLPGVDWRARRLAVIALDGLEPILGRAFGGILGQDFFQRFVITIDPSRRAVAISDPDRAEAPASATVVPMWIEANEPFLVGIVHVAGRAHPAKLKIDTGSLDVLGLNGSFVAQTRMLPETYPRLRALGTALGGNTENFGTRLDSLVVAGFSMAAPVVGFSTDLERKGDAGTIGQGWLTRFRATFDEPHRRLWLEPVDAVRPVPEYDLSGLFLVAAPQDSAGITVLSVDANSPAAQAGLRAGGRLITIDAASVGAADLFRVRDLLRRPGPVTLRVRRGARVIDSRLVGRRRI